MPFLDISAIISSMETQRQVLEQVRINSVYILKIFKDKLVGLGSFKLMLLVVTPSVSTEMETSFSMISFTLSLTINT
jgi:hypothetical protein